MRSVVAKRNMIHISGHTKTSNYVGLGTTILVVGEISHWLRSDRHFPDDAKIIFTDFHEITATMIAVANPKFILSPLLCPVFDCIDLSILLGELGYSGMYRILAPSLPNPKLILSEISILGGNLDVDFILEKRINMRRVS